MSSSITKVALASFIGTTIEWYDFLLYGTAAALVFNRLFFPELDAAVGTVAALATFATGYFARPIGAMIFGHFGDTRGRKSMLFVTLLIMGLATVAVGLLPTYHQIGVLAPLLLIGLRLCQGIGLGGEWGAAVLMAVEHAPVLRRGFFGSWPQMGAPAGLLLANLLFLAVASLPEEQFFSWGWRVPFLLSIVLVVLGLIIRTAIAESPAFVQLKQHNQQSRRPVLEVIRQHPRLVLLTAGARCVEIGFLNVLSTFVLSYATLTLGLPRSAVIGATLLVIVFVLVIIPLAGAASDYVGRRTVYLFGAISATLLIVPACLLIDSGQIGLLTIGMAVGIFGAAVAFGPQATYFAELFGTRVRYTGASLGFQLGSVLAGGLAPLVAASLAAAWGSLVPVAWFLVGLGIITLACLRGLGETRPTPERMAEAAPLRPSVEPSA
jgi:metabolite-proton symporter